jgi:hypothetical protein
MTPISQYGMSDYFRDEFSKIEDQFKEFTFTCVFNTAQTIAPFKINVTGSNVNFIEKGMQVTIPQSTGSIIANVVGVFDENNIYLDRSPGAPIAVPNGTDVFNTVAFEDAINGWVSFYTYEPKFMASLKNKYYSFFGSDIYEHYDNTTANNAGLFYGVRSNSNITFIFNPIVSVTKNFNTVSYEGSNGWQIDSYKSDFQGFDLVNSNYIENQDVTNSVKSYDEGLYTENGIPLRAGFNRKENRYVANLVSNSTVRAGEVIFGNAMSGIKGYFATVKISTDNTTQLGGPKELFSVSSNYVLSSY